MYKSAKNIKLMINNVQTIKIRTHEIIQNQANCAKEIKHKCRPN